MAVDLKEVKINVRSLLTSSKDPVSLEKLRTEYYKIEGMTLPYKRLGFNSDIELLQSMTDILTLPQNPSPSSILSLIVDEKTNHLRQLVVKQKSSTPKKNKKSNFNGKCYTYNNANKNKKSPNVCHNIVNNNYINNFQKINNYGKHNTQYFCDDNQRNLPSTSNNVYFNQNHRNQNGTHCSGHVTDALRAYLEFKLSQNPKQISKTKLEELVRSHEDFPVLKSKNMNEIFNKLESFLNINDTGVSLKDKNHLEFKKNTPIIYQDKSSKVSKESDVNQSQNNNSHKNSALKNGFNNCHKTINSPKQFGSDSYNNTNVLSELKTNDHHLSNIACNNNFKMFLQKVKHIPQKVLFNIARIFEVYNYGVNIENFKFIYHEEYYTTIDPSVYGFTTFVQMLEALDEFIDIKKEVIYTKPNFAFSMLYKNIHYNNDALEKQINNNNTVNNRQNISLDIFEKSPFIEFARKCKMVMVEAYNPSLFFLQLESNIAVLKDLMNNMLTFYEKENSNYCVQPDQVLPGFIYASSYTTFSVVKQWYRVRILREVNSLTVEVIHVDYGTIDNIPKTEIRFLHKKFSNLPCQAIHCCLDSYNELASIKPEVTKAFLEIIDDEPVYVQVNKYFCLKSRNKILHVTLFKSENKNKNNMKNINNELTIYHLNH